MLKCFWHYRKIFLSLSLPPLSQLFSRLYSSDQMFSLLMKRFNGRECNAAHNPLPDGLATTTDCRDGRSNIHLREREKENIKNFFLFLLLFILHKQKPRRIKREKGEKIKKKKINSTSSPSTPSKCILSLTDNSVLGNKWRVRKRHNFTFIDGLNPSGSLCVFVCLCSRILRCDVRCVMMMIMMRISSEA